MIVLEAEILLVFKNDAILSLFSLHPVGGESVGKLAEPNVVAVESELYQPALPVAVLIVVGERVALGGECRRGFSHSVPVAENLQVVVAVEHPLARVAGHAEELWGNLLQRVASHDKFGRGVLRVGDKGLPILIIFHVAQIDMDRFPVVGVGVDGLRSSYIERVALQSGLYPCAGLELREDILYVIGHLVVAHHIGTGDAVGISRRAEEVAHRLPVEPVVERALRRVDDGVRLRGHVKCRELGLSDAVLCRCGQRG